MQIKAGYDRSKSNLYKSNYKLTDAERFYIKANFTCYSINLTESFIFQPKIYLTKLRQKQPIEITTFFSTESGWTTRRMFSRVFYSRSLFALKSFKKIVRCLS